MRTATAALAFAMLLCLTSAAFAAESRGLKAITSVSTTSTATDSAAPFTWPFPPEAAASFFKYCSNQKTCGQCWCGTVPFYGVLFGATVNIDTLSAASFSALYQSAGLSYLDSHKAELSTLLDFAAVRTSFIGCTTYLPASESIFQILSGPGKTLKDGVCSAKAVKMLNQLGQIPSQPATTA